MATFSQERHVELVAGGDQTFTITNLMVSASIPTELPTLGVFVIDVIDPLDPKQDALSRVATIADLTTIPEGRDPGIAAPGPNGVQYLSTSWIASYATLETALDAAQAFRDRVNKLIIDWQSFRTSFVATPTPASYTFPATDTSPKTTLIAAYKIAKQDRYQKQIAKTTADAALVAAQADLTYKQGLVSGTLPLVAATTVNQTEFAATSGFFSSLIAAGSTFAAANPGGVGLATFQSALVLAASQGAQVTAYIADTGALITITTSYKTARDAEVAAATSTLASATTDQVTKATALTSALALEAAALAAVMAICPDFDRHSIPFVDDTEP